MKKLLLILICLIFTSVSYGEIKDHLSKSGFISENIKYKKFKVSRIK